MTLVVAIDGPSGSGKSTAGQLLARELKLAYVDSGALYRAVALLCLRAADPEAAAKRAGELARNARLEPRWDGRRYRVLLDGEDVTRALRRPEVSLWASRVSADPEVRQVILSLLRELGGAGVVMDGRDIGTVVFPGADHKFYLVASVEERGRRRAAEETTSDRGAVERALAQRDRNDSSRTHAPLKAAADAQVIDTTRLTPDQVVRRMLERIRGRAEPAGLPTGPRG